ncbi:phosphoenolpyruvate synthase [Myxococcus stipitatus DSM 14675]|uniref:Phosphoenolpyruvate synthase n=1 Tax=Myxococcus stipitatus (strain DSM 14675 / JCM 12634 / Mx s8) TaxID=1278073 RepID=L7UDG0_MYXSD|nr:PEP-utilizing enzyme [Myxococcus stipitatus]AGC46093.1 phosphoenolpyruvate synthase [Myxococcus stipitatus DSM 14675]
MRLSAEIQTVVPSEAVWESPVPGAHWLRTWRLGEWLREPLSPLFETLLLPALTKGREHSGSGRFGFRMPRAWHMQRPSYMVANGYFFARADPDPLSVFLLPPRFLFSELRGGWVDRWEQQGIRAYIDRVEGYGRRVESAGSSVELLHALDQLSLDVAEVWYVLSLASGGAAPLMQFLRGVGGRELRDVLGEDQLILYRGFWTRSLEAQQSVFLLAQEVSSTPGLEGWLEEGALPRLLREPQAVGVATDFRQRVLQHLELYGHETSVLDFVTPTLAENPGPLAIALRCYCSPQAAEPARTVERLQQEREAATEKLRGLLRGPRRLLFDSLLKRGQRYAVAREDAVFYLQMGWPVFRALLLELGRRLAEKGTLAAAEDVFYLTTGELHVHALHRLGQKLVREVAERKARREARRQLTPPVRIPAEASAWESAMRWPVNLRQLCAETESTASVLQGTAASPGRVRALARVLSSPAEFDRLEEGEVLVAVATTPTWTPLFARASAVVTDVGAISSHSSIVAREYGIPAVVGTQQATRVIRDGQMVTVDGTAGRVHLE